MASATWGHLRDLFGAGTAVGLGDGALLARYASGRDGAAFEALVARHGPMVLATCRAVLRHEHDVEDAFQATFLVLARKAGSIRGGDALGGWLHRVAYRAAVGASVEARRRRLKEAEASAMAPPTGSRPDPEWQAVLHEEIERLPESRRLPVVLCDLEGLTYDEAARRLGWTVPTLRTRLAKARQKLRDRLTRRGVSERLALPIAPMVPAALARSAVSAAAGIGPTSAGAALLTHTILKGMFMTRLKIASTAAMAAVGLAAAGFVAAGSFRADGPAMKPAAREKAEAAVAPPPSSKPGELVEVRGVVVDPAGKPVAGASVRTAYLDLAGTPDPETTAGPDGRFLLRVPKPARPRSGLDAARYPFVVASAPGFGLGWTDGAFKDAPPGGLTVRLAEDGTPIEGRVVDLEGRPVAGATIKVETARYAFGVDLGAWIARAKDRGLQGPWEGLEGIPTTIATTTGPDGRFRLAGIGHDRVADLLISGPTIASAKVRVVTRDGAGFSALNRPMMMPKPIVFRSPKFEHVAAPTKWVEGVARDQDTGRPIVGLSVQASASEDHGPFSAPDVVARTDGQGRYRLIGLPRAPAYHLSTYFIPGKDQPYPRANLRAPADSPALEPVTFDFALKRGVVVRGRLLDKATGKPAVGYVHAYTFPDNPHLGEFPGFARSGLLDDPVDAEGRYELVVPPGRILLAARSELGDYRGAVGEGIAGFDAKYKSFDTLPRRCNVGNYHALAEANLDPRAESATVDLQVDPGRTVPVKAVDPEGRPIGGTVAKGIGDLFQSTTYPQESASFEVHALEPSRPRRVVVTHFARKLVGQAFLKGDEAGPVTIRLQPWGTVAGRIVDDEGAPRKGMALMSLGGSQPAHPEVNGILPEGDWGGGIKLGADGRFRVQGLVPGLRYGGSAVEGPLILGNLFEGVIVAPGEVKDLGDLKVTPMKREAN